MRYSFPQLLANRHRNYWLSGHEELPLVFLPSTKGLTQYRSWISRTPKLRIIWCLLPCMYTLTRTHTQTRVHRPFFLSSGEIPSSPLSETIGVLSCLLDNIRKLGESTRQETSQKDVDNPTSPLIKDHLGRQLGPRRDSLRRRLRRPRSAGEVSFVDERLGTSNRRYLIKLIISGNPDFRLLVQLERLIAKLSSFFFAGQLLFPARLEEKQLSSSVMYLPLTRIFASVLPISG